VDWDGRISRCGDEMMRTMLYEAAQAMMRIARQRPNTFNAYDLL
jgi:transposase